MNSLQTPALSPDYVLRAELELDGSILRLEGDVLEHFGSATLSSRGRLLMRGVTAGVAGPDRHGRYELRVIDGAGGALILLPVTDEQFEEAEAFASSIRYAASGTAAVGAAEPADAEAQAA